MPVPDDHPVIIGVGQATWRDPEPDRTPVDALAEVTASALADCGSERVAAAVDTFATVRFIADTNPASSAVFPRNPGAAVAARLGLGDPALYIGIIGGNTPQFLVNHFAVQLARGERRVVVLAGAELMATFFHALHAGLDLSGWAGEAAREPPVIGVEKDGLNEQESRHGLYKPINTYPLFENSLRHHLGNSPEQHAALIAAISSRMSAVAAANPFAWRRERLSADAIGTVAVNNRYIGYPYTRAMNAVLEVDMGAAVVMTTAGTARELGVDPARWIFFRGGADVNDIWFPTERAELHSSPAIRLAWRALSGQSGLDIDAIGKFDIYSCFPSAVQVACAELGMSPLDERGVTVTGGLPYFGGPGNNYSLHAIAQMVTELRESGGHGLVTANGLYLTKHSLGLYSAETPDTLPAAVDNAALQREIDAGPRIPAALDAAGEATVETWTVAFDRDGPKRGIIVARNDRGERVVANATPDPRSLQALVDADPIGRRGRVEVVDGLNIMHL